MNSQKCVSVSNEARAILQQFDCIADRENQLWQIMGFALQTCGRYISEYQPFQREQIHDSWIKCDYFFQGEKGVVVNINVQVLEGDLKPTIRIDSRNTFYNSTAMGYEFTTRWLHSFQITYQGQKRSFGRFNVSMTRRTIPAAIYVCLEVIGSFRRWLFLTSFGRRYTLNLPTFQLQLTRGHMKTQICIIVLLISSLLCQPRLIAASNDDVLNANEQLRIGESIVSPNGRFELVMQSDGNLVLYQNGLGAVHSHLSAMWSSGTFDTSAARVVMQSDGNLVLYRTDGSPIWSSNTYGSQSTLRIQDDGNLVIYLNQNTPVWATNVSLMGLGSDEEVGVNEKLTSRDGRFHLILQTDNNLVLYQQNIPLWASNTVGSGATRLRMQSDGNLVLYSSDYSAVWETGTYGQGASFLIMQEDGNAVVYRMDGSPIWATGTSSLPDSARISIKKAEAQPPIAHCVHNIENVFREGVFGYRITTRGGVEEGPTGRFRIHMSEGVRLPPEEQRVTGAGGLKSHVESIVRVPGGGEYNWMVMGRQRSSLGAPFYVFEIGSPPKAYDGERLVKFDRLIDHYYDLYRDNPRGLDGTRAYLEIPSTKHIGGMQAMGNIVAMPVTCDSPACATPSVMFWDFSSPLQPRLMHQLPLIAPPHDAHWVAVTSLPSGQLLTIVNRADDGTTDAFITEDSGPLDSSTRWNRLPRFNISVPEWDTGNGTYQNANFLWGCETGGLYLLGMRQLGRVLLKQWRDDNLVELFRVDGPFTSGDPLRLTYVSGATFERFGDYCQMRGGASVYVEPDGSPVVYCAAGESDNNALKVSEITAVGWR